jgi:hypothetical protein
MPERRRSTLQVVHSKETLRAKIMGSGLEISVFSQCLNDLAHRRVMNPQMIGNRLQRITMLDMRTINLLIS